MNRIALTKPDGRMVFLYADEPLRIDGDAPSPVTTPHAPNAHLRWHPLRGEWVAYATHRQDRTFLPPSGYDPLAPSAPGQAPTEVPAGNWQIAVFENLFPTFTMGAHDPPALDVATRPALGVCEVVVFTQERQASLGTLPRGHLELLIDVWADRYDALGQRPEIEYVFAFENRGVEVGVTLHHPHGQIYAYPFVPPIAAKELALQRAHFDQRGRGLLEEIVAREVGHGRRLIYSGELVTAFMPTFARYPYEVWIAPRRPAGSFVALTRDERRDFARALRTIVRKFDRLWGLPFPYVLAFHQAPTDGQPHPEAHLHGEFYPAYRMSGRLKYLAGSEVGAGVFTADTVPEDKVKELQAVEVDSDD